MFRMKFRSNPIGIGFLVLGAGLIGTMHLNPIFGGKEFLYDLPLIYIAPAQLAIPFLFAIASYRACPFIQQISAFFITLGLVFLLGLIGNFTTYDPNRLAIFQKTLEIHFNVFQLGIMNIMAMIAALKCMQVEQMSSFADTQVAEAQLGRLKSNKVDPDQQAKWEKAASNADRSHEGRSLRSTMTNLKAISLSDPSQELKPTVPANREDRNKAKAQEAEDGGSLASLLDRMGDEPAPVAGEELAQEASLAKSIDEIPDVPEAKIAIPEAAAEIKQEQAEDFHPKSVDAPSDSFLSKFLDREEDGDGLEKPAPEVSAPEISPTVISPTDIKEEEKSSQPISNAGFRMTSQSAKTDAALAKIDAEEPKEEQAPPVKPETAPAIEAPAQDVEPAPGSTNNRMQAMKRRNTSTFTKLQSLSASGTGSLLPTPEEKVQESSEPDSLKSLLDRLDEEKPEAKEESVVSDKPAKAPLEDAHMLSLNFVFGKKKEEAVKEEPAKEESKARPSMSERMHAAEEHKAEPEAKSEPLEEVSAPEPEPEPQPEPKQDLDEAPLLATSDATGEEPPVGLVEKEEQESPVHEEEEDEEDKGTLFEGGVDNDIDDIFSNLAPPEAQLEVKDLIAAKKDDKPTVKEEAAPAEGQDSEDDDKGVLFEGGVDSDIDDIFSQLAPPEGQREVKDHLPKAVDKKPADVIKSDTTEEDESEGLFDSGLGEDLDNIFSGLTESEQKEVNAETLSKYKKPDGEEKAKPAEEKKAEPVKAEAPKAEVPKAESKTEAKADAKADAKDGPAGAKYKEVKEFGRLSNRSAAQPKTATESVGTMKTIGKLLLDVHAVENIIKAGESKKLGSGLSTAKVISAARGEGIKNILTSIDTYEGVAGSLIVGHDGLVIASTVGQGWDKDMLGALSTALLSTSNLATKKLEIGKLRQMVLLTELGKGEFKTTLLTDVEVGILAVFIEKTDLSKIDGLLETIHKTIHGG